MTKIVSLLFLMLCMSCCSSTYPNRKDVIISLKDNYWNAVKPVQNTERMFFSTQDLSVIIGLPFTSSMDSAPYTYSMSMSVEPMFHTRSADGKSTIKHKVTSQYTFVPTDVYLIKNGKKQKCKLHGEVQKYNLLSTTSKYPWFGSMDFSLPYAFSSLEGATVHIGGIEKDGKPIPPLEFTIHKAQ